MLATFCGMHIFMIFQNKGTLDSVVPIFKSSTNIYDIGRFNNFTQVFGDDPYYWVLPVFSSKGDGYSFPTNNNKNNNNDNPKDVLIG